MRVINIKINSAWHNAFGIGNHIRIRIRNSTCSWVGYRHILNNIRAEYIEWVKSTGMAPDRMNDSEVQCRHQQINCKVFGWFVLAASQRVCVSVKVAVCVCAQRVQSPFT